MRAAACAQTGAGCDSLHIVVRSGGTLFQHAFVRSGARHRADERTAAETRVRGCWSESMNSKDLVKLGVPLGEPMRHAVTLISKLVLSGKKEQLESELKAVLADPAAF